MTDEPHVHRFEHTRLSDFVYTAPGDDYIINSKCRCGIRPIDILREMIETGEFPADDSPVDAEVVI